MDARLPLPTLLSHALVALTIEFDNEFERAMPHRTTNAPSGTKSRDNPWLVSMVMWSNFMQYVPEDGISVRDLQRQARITDEVMHTSLSGMHRWGYVSVGSDTKTGQAERPRPESPVRPTAAGRKAQGIWEPLFATIEKRWEERFGSPAFAGLRQALADVVDRLDRVLPDYLPLYRYGLWAEVGTSGGAARGDGQGSSDMTLPAQLSKVLLAFTLDFERQSDVSLAISANVLRLLGEPVRVRDLPRRAGVSKEAIATSMSFLDKQGYTDTEPESSGSRVKALSLTQKGGVAQKTYVDRVWAIEDDWRGRFGQAATEALRDALDAIVGRGGPESRLFEGLAPHPDNWRASVAPPDALPYHPMVLHRGGYPDGS